MKKEDVIIAFYSEQKLKDEKSIIVFTKKKKQKKHVARKHVKIRITCYNTDIVLSELDNITDNAVTLMGNISRRDDYLVQSAIKNQFRA